MRCVTFHWWLCPAFVDLLTCDLGILCHLCVDRKIKVWDLAAALDPRAPTGTLCVRTLVVSVAVGFVGTVTTNPATRFTAVIQVNLRSPAPPVKNWRILLVQSFTARVLQGKTLEFSSTVLSLHCLRTSVLSVLETRLYYSI